MENKYLLSTADFTAIEMQDSGFINDKGAHLYQQENFETSVEYYRLAAAMGNDIAISNLGYCYLYGRSIKQDITLAIAYFKIAAQKNNVDAAYKLGDIYASEKWNIQDKELSIYYYMKAVKTLIGESWIDRDNIVFLDELDLYPSLCFAMGREFSAEGDLLTNLDLAYQFLKHAEIGYEREINNGNIMYSKSLESVKNLLDNDEFVGVKEHYDLLFDFINPEETEE